MPSPLETAINHLQDQRFAQAESLLRRVLQRTPADPDANRLMGVAVGRQGRIDQARFFFDRAIAAAPASGLAHLNFGNVLLAGGRNAEAVPHLRRATEAMSDSFEPWNSLCSACVTTAAFDEAIAAGQKAAALAPTNPSVLLNFGSCLGATGDVQSSIAALEKALAIAPDDPSLIATFLMATNYDPSRTTRQRFEDHRRLGARLVSLSPSLAPLAPRPRAAETNHRLRIGYLSYDLRQHVVPVFLRAIIEHRDRARFEVFAYQTGPMDSVSEQLRTLVDHWRHAESMTDVQLVQRIRADRIDILIDLSGHTDGSRPGVLAMRPAPVQATYLGYPNTTGLPAMDYRIVDGITDPPGAEALSTERLIRLPHCFLAFTPPHDAPDITPLPPGPITFASFNAAPKINDQLLALWAKVLHAVPDSRLLIKNRGLACSRTREQWGTALSSSGITPDRIDLRPWEPSPHHHLAAYNHVHIALDSFPYHGTTTTCEALWMGVPVVTLAGDSHLSRVGASLLSAVGLPELIATTPDDCIHRAATLARDFTALSQMRTSLRERVRLSPLCDAMALSRAIENAYLEMAKAHSIPGQ